ncbi:MAG: hypothetical protein WBH50_08355, partial [Fuerstiella sp.]
AKSVHGSTTISETATCLISIRMQETHEVTGILFLPLNETKHIPFLKADWASSLFKPELHFRAGKSAKHTPLRRTR